MPGSSESVKGALTLLRELRARAGRALAPETAEKVGALYSDLYSLPEAYQRGRAYQKDLATQFGTSQKRPYDQTLNPGYAIEHGRGPSSAALYAEDIPYNQMLPRQGFNLTAAAAGQAGLLRPGSVYRVMDTAAAKQGSGAGTALYAHAYGDLLRSPQTYNLVDALSEVNKTRRSLNMSSAIGRDPRLGSRLLLAPSQLPSEDGVVGALRAYHGLPPERQIGALQAMAARRTADALGTRLLDAGRMPSPEAQARAEELARAVERALGAGAQPNDAYALASAFRATPQRPSGVFPSSLGPASARKLALTNMALRNEAPRWGQMEEWGRGLEYRRGGAVR